MENGQPPEGGRWGGKAGRERGHDRRVRHHLNARSNAGVTLQLCDLHGECVHSTKDYHTIAARRECMNRDKPQPPQEEEPGEGATSCPPHHRDRD